MFTHAAILFFQSSIRPPGEQRAQTSRGRKASKYTELLMADRTQYLRPWLYLVLVAGLNAYICQEAFLTESTGHWHSMHGAWMAMAAAAYARILRWFALPSTPPQPS